MLKCGPAHSGQLRMNFPNSFIWMFPNNHTADYTSMDEMGIMYYRGRSPLQSTGQLLNKIWALEPSESAGAATKVVRPISCHTAEWINILTGEADKIQRDIDT